MYSIRYLRRLCGALDFICDIRDGIRRKKYSMNVSKANWGLNAVTNVENIKHLKEVLLSGLLRSCIKDRVARGMNAYAIRLTH